MTIDYLFNQLMLGNASIINSDNIKFLNDLALGIYQQEELSTKEIEDLKKIIMCCNVLYNRTDLTILPVEDGFYDVLLEKYKTYDEHFQVGSAIVNFKNTVANDITNPQKIAVQPIIFEKIPERNEVRQSMYENIMRINQPILNINDFAISPIEFMQDDLISKRTHDTAHNHPDLVGTLDKAKLIFVKDAISAGVQNDPNVKVLERDFFGDHISKGIYDRNRVLNIVVELKYDGISVEADCDSEVVSARTRGDTAIGAASDITPILKGYTFKQARCMIGEKPIGVKFEAIMTKSNLEKFNELRGRSYSNCRTAIIGLFGASDGYKYRDLITLVPLALDRYDIPNISNRMEEIQFLNKVFISHGEPLRYCYMQGTVTELLYLIKAFWDEAIIARDFLNFMYDGIVIEYLDDDIRKKLGRVNYINKYSMAVKFNPLEKQTIFRGYTYEVGQNGQITPMIHYDPVEFIGTIHTKSTGSSYNRFMDLGLRYGDYININYVNDVMPYVTKLDCESNRNNTNEIEQFISECPICGSKLIESDSGKTIICPNIECPGRSVSRMSNMFYKLNIKGFADATFIALGKTHLYELINLDLDWLKEKLGEADGYKFKETMNSLVTKPINDYIVMGSLGFSSIARKKWKGILEKITLKNLYEMYRGCNTESEFEYLLSTSINGIGDITASTIAKEFPFFEYDILSIMTWNIIDSYGVNVDYKAQIRFTGCRNKQLSELLCNAGYDADDSLSAGKKTDILLVPYDGFSSSKVSKVSEKCKIIPINEFISNMKSYIGEELL